ncbi:MULTISPECIES: tryptophan synthase subunit alpha [unclassified Curtobacterium]|uniref:tryptophan synthase subunit alpha n=1 Tax=unclassified Curtobacterium TaxID=257496 RepID=UPI000DA97124|nr:MULTISPECIES: tryptophan synthase subunit alpha [unclassified Curtobacterium]PZE25035.1 tryptophan synthase subunit alpha [Curtobacterium sp. MCBD17_028]PZF56836.1 tryptophan synthase subunit alpha [Curtobacterium sp. MCBD17_034]PZF60660.1 tryptophan synthase subunit alpha [Curtobacterium sp. MCBD17_013]PZM33792.1 tryptophan synthase subunit alpha [Curtobacterium sp. MCBD17_031]
MAESRNAGRSLEVLRAEAAEEIAVIVEHRCRQGDDPWEFMHLIPTVDEQVVLILRAEAIEVDSRIEHRAGGRTQHPSSGSGTVHGEEYHRLRRIALAHPELSSAVWKLMGAIPEGR